MSDLVEAAAGVVGATLIYLVTDTFPAVKSFSAPFRSGSFYLLWLILSVLNLISYGVLNLSFGQRISGTVGPSLAPLTMVLLATIGTIGILQSLTLKLADYKFVDVGKMLDGFKAAVVADIMRNDADRERLRTISVAHRLSQHYTLDRLRTEYTSVMTYQGSNVSQVGEELAQLQKDCSAANTSFERAICERIAKSDLRRAEELLRLSTPYRESPRL